MGVDLGSDFESGVAALAGWDASAVQPGTVAVTFLNPDGPTTVMATIRVDVDTDELKTLIRDAAQ